MKRRLKVALVGVVAAVSAMSVAYTVTDVADAWPYDCHYRKVHSRASSAMCWKGDRSDAYALRQRTTCGLKYGNVARIDSDGSNVSWSGCDRTTYYILKWENY